MTLKKLSSFLLLSVFVGVSHLHAEGISTSFSDEVIHDVPMGRIFLVPGPTGGGLVVQNNNAAPILIRVQALTPTTVQLRRGAIPVPDMNWVTLDPSELVIPPGGQGVFHIHLLIPPLKKHAVKTYQIMFHAQEIPQKKDGVQVSKALLSRLIFTTSKLR